MIFRKTLFQPLALGCLLLSQAALPSIAADAPVLKLSSVNKDNVFLADQGELVLTLEGAAPGATGTIIITDEYGNEQRRLPIATGSSEVAIPLPGKGYYHISASLDGTDAKAATSAAVIGKALTDEERMQSIIGLWNVHGDKKGLAAAGAHYNRKMTAFFNRDEDFLRYADPSVKPETPGRPRPADEPVFADIGVLSFGLPMWMMDVPEDQKRKSYGNPTRAPRDWDQLKQLAKAFANNPPWEEFPPYFEIYNEPEWQWEGTDEDFVRFLATIAQGIKEARPDVQILGPGFSQPRLQTSNRIGLIDVERLGLFEHLDGIVVHCYVDGSAPEGEFIQNIIDLRNFLKETGHGDMPVHYTEFGWTSYPGTWQRPVDELTQAQYLVRSIALLATQDAASAVYFCYIFSGNGKLGEQGFSIAHMDTTPKPSYASYSNLARWLAGAEAPYRWLRLSPDTHMVLYGRDGGTLAIVWDAEGTSEFILPAGFDRIDDMVGRPLKAAAGGKVELSGSPIFVEWPKVSAEHFTEAESLTLMRGNDTPFADANAQKWIVPAPLSIKDGQIVAPADAPVGPYILLARTEQGWHTQPVEVIAPLKVSAPQLSWPAAAPQPLLTASAESFTTNLLRVRASAAVKDLRSFFADAQEVAPGKTTEIDIPLDGLTMGKRYKGEFEVISQGADQRDRLVQPFEFTVVSSQPVGSGQPDWAKIPAVDFSDWEQFGGPIAPEDCSATFQSAYSTHGLYMRVVVRDDHHVQNASAEQMWSQDAIQIGIDMDIDKPWSANEFFGLKGHRVFEYGVGGNPGREMTWRWISYLPDLPIGQAESRMGLKIDRTGDITTYDIFFPWVVLGADEAPKAGSSIGIALALSDADPDRMSERRALRLFNGILDSKDPERFGRLWLR